MRHFFGTIEVRPCELWEWSDTGERYVEETSDDDAHFWGVYKQSNDGRMLWIADFTTYDEAVKFAKVLGECHASN